MADETKDQRIVVLMTPTELEAIDAWSFANRIRSRGEAIRRLCQTGLTFDSESGTLGEGQSRLKVSMRSLLAVYNEEAEDSEAWLSRYFDAVDALVDIAIDVDANLSKLGAVARYMAKDGALPERANELRKLLAETRGKRTAAISGDVPAPAEPTGEPEPKPGRKGGPDDK